MKISKLGARILLSATIATAAMSAQNASAHLLGVSGESSTNDALVAKYKSLGVKSVRLWMGINSWGSADLTSGTVKAAKYYKSKGFDVMIAVVPHEGLKVPSPAQVTATFNKIVSDSALLKSVDRWELGNEPDRHEYWAGSLSTYVSVFVKPAAAVLHSKGEKVVSGGPSWNPEAVKAMVDAGLLNYVDFVGYHPYRNSPSEVASAIAKVKAYARGKPIVASEWTVRGYVEQDSSGVYHISKGKSAQQWSDANAKAFNDTLRNNTYASYYFATYVKATAMAGLGSLMYSGSLKANGSFYSMYQGFAKSVGNATTTDSTDSTDPTAPTIPSNPSSSLTLNLSIVDSQTDRAISGFADVSGSKTLDLEKVRISQYGIVADSDDNIGSIEFVVNGKRLVESNPPYSFFGDNAIDGIKGTTAKNGTFTITATPYSGDNATGNAGTSKTLVLKVIDTGN